MACLRFEAGSLLPFSGGAQTAGQAQLNPTAGQAPLPKAEASRPHSKVDAAAGQQKNRHFRVLASLPQQIPHPMQFFRQRQLRDWMNTPSGC